MKRALAINTAKWLAKRENREKVKRAALKFKARMEREDDVNEKPGGNDSSGHKRS